MTLGDFLARHEGVSGVGVSFLFSSTDLVNQRLSLLSVYNGDATDIHHGSLRRAGRRLAPFDLPGSIWSGYSTIPSVLLTINGDMPMKVGGWHNRAFQCKCIGRCTDLTMEAFSHP